MFSLNFEIISQTVLAFTSLILLAGKLIKENVFYSFSVSERTSLNYISETSSFMFVSSISVSVWFSSLRFVFTKILFFRFASVKIL